MCWRHGRRGTSMKRARWRCRLRFSCCNPPVLSPAYLGLLSLLRDPENPQTLEAKGPLMWSGLADIGTENAERKECSKLVALSAGCSFYKLPFIEYLMGFPGGAVVKICLPMQKTQKRLESDPWVEKIPLEEGTEPTPVFLPGKSHGQRSLAGWSPGGCKE